MRQVLLTTAVLAFLLLVLAAMGSRLSTEKSWLRKGAKLLGWLMGVYVLACLVAVGFVLLKRHTVPPVMGEAHVREVRTAVEKAGGRSAILRESRILFARLTNESDIILSLENTRRLDGLPGLKSLGDVFHYYPKGGGLPGRVLIRRHNSHWDTYFIQLVNPEEIQKSELEGFIQIVGNIGFIKRDATAGGKSPQAR
jgi:hypothetical protein